MPFLLRWRMLAKPSWFVVHATSMSEQAIGALPQGDKREYEPDFISVSNLMSFIGT